MNSVVYFNIQNIFAYYSNAREQLQRRAMYEEVPDREQLYRFHQQVVANEYKKFLYNGSRVIPFSTAVYRAKYLNLSIPEVVSIALKDLEQLENFSHLIVLSKKIMNKFIALQSLQSTHQLDPYEMFKICTIAEKIMENNVLPTRAIRIDREFELFSHPLLIDYKDKKYTILLEKEASLLDSGGFGTVWTGIEIAEYPNPPFQPKIKAKVVAEKVAKKMPLIEIESAKKYGSLKTWVNYREGDFSKTVYTMRKCQFNLFDFLVNKIKVELSVKNKLEIVRDFITTISQMHEDGVIHGDLKIENLMVRFKDGRYRGEVIDFGACYKPLEGGVPKLNKMYGSPYSTSPEVLINSSHAYGLKERKQQDIYAFGLALISFFLDENPTSWYEDMVALRAGNEEIIDPKEAETDLYETQGEIWKIIDDLNEKQDPSFEEMIELFAYKTVDPSANDRPTAVQLLEEVDKLLVLADIALYN